eukprot:1155033-Pelagomonas_calceolata.AAC.2
MMQSHDAGRCTCMAILHPHLPAIGAQQNKERKGYASQVRLRARREGPASRSFTGTAILYPDVPAIHARPALVRACLLSGSLCSPGSGRPNPQIYHTAPLA